MPTEPSSYLSGYAQVLLFVVVGLLFVLMALLISRLIRPRRPGIEKLSAYESGEEAVGIAWIQFNVRYFIVALAFLLFEVEIIFIFPWAIIFNDSQLQEQTNGQWGWFAFAEMMIFIAILLLGLAYVWAKGYFDWARPSADPPAFKSPVPDSFYEAINTRYGRKTK